MRVISIDPGIMTGYCYAEIESQQLRYFPFQIVDEVDDLWRRLKEFGPRYIIIEDFEFRRGKRSAGGLELFPVQMIGVSRLYSLIANPNCACFVQKAAQGKAYYTDPVLKQLGLHKRGIPHGIDASRHLLQWYTFGAGYQFAGSKKTEECVTLLNSWEERR